LTYRCENGIKLYNKECNLLEIDMKFIFKQKEYDTDHFTCPISYDFIVDPVTTSGCGHSFERNEIANAARLKAACPTCRAPISDASRVYEANSAPRNGVDMWGVKYNYLVSNPELKAAIAHYLNTPELLAKVEEEEQKQSDAVRVAAANKPLIEGSATGASATQVPFYINEDEEFARNLQAQFDQEEDLQFQVQAVQQQAPRPAVPAFNRFNQPLPVAAPPIGAPLLVAFQALAVAQAPVAAVALDPAAERARKLALARERMRLSKT